MRRSGLLGAALLLSAIALPAAVSDTVVPRVNVLFITADDMNYDTPGAAGGKTPDVTPNLNKLASEGMRFVNAHVTVAVCQPSRECLMTGRYPHHNGATGFYPVHSDVPTLIELLKAAGYQSGIMAKVSHLAPPAKFPWDYIYEATVLGNGRDPALYYKSAKEFFDRARKSGQPFFLMANSQDPHRPWAGSDGEKLRAEGKQGGKKKAKAKANTDNDNEIAGGVKYPPPSRIYQTNEVVVPGFLPDLPDVRKEVAQYYSSAHRCDETVGSILRALDDAGLSDNTLVMFVSDNGISMPFAKSNCYLTSTRTPWMARWPGKIKPGTVDEDHFISGIDFMPTILEALALSAPAGMDGRSFLPLLSGKDQGDRDHVFTCYNDTSGHRRYPMRCLQTKRFGYIFNDWSDGETRYQAEPMGGLTFHAMQQAAPKQPDVAKRVELLVHRVPEELYDFSSDPNGLKNLIGDPKYTEQAAQMRKAMLAWMEKNQDPLTDHFRAKAAKSNAP